MIPEHRQEQKYILKTSLSSLSLECQWELEMARMSSRFKPCSVMFDVDAPQRSISCAAGFFLAFLGLSFYFFFLLPLEKKPHTHTPALRHAAEAEDAG